MKEAAGEANMTVITIVLIAVVLAVGGIIVSNVMNSIEKSSACAAAGGTWNSGACKTGCTTDKGVTTCNGADLTCTKGTNGMECK